MLTDYHVHIERGPYTFEWLDRFMATARENQVEEIGIVEHSHRFAEFRFLYEHLRQDNSATGQYQKQWMQKRLAQSSLDEYINFMYEAKRRGYPVKMGFEICYIPEHAETLRTVLDSIECDFVIGSVHWLKDWGFDHPQITEEWSQQNKADIRSTYNQYLLSAIRSDLFDIIGHIDSIKAFNPWSVEDWLTDEILKTLKEHNTCIEVNTGVKYRVNCSEFCPSKTFLEKCFTSGIPITLASDAHNPEDVGRLFTESVALVQQCGYTSINRFSGRKRQSIKTMGFL